jgi:hypothetical protein
MLWNQISLGNTLLSQQLLVLRHNYPSYAQTGFVVDENPSTPAPTDTPLSISDQYFAPAIAGILVAIILVGALLALLVLKRRP